MKVRCPLKGAHSCRLCRRWLEGEWSRATPEERVEIQCQMAAGHCDDCHRKHCTPTTTESDMHVPTIAFTDALAEHAHRGQPDKAGNPYIDHPRAVAEALELRGDNAIHAALLHDVVEDTDITLEILAALGYPPEVLNAVDSVTRRDGEMYFDMILRAAADPLGCVVKMADNRHNFGRLDNLSPSEAAFLRKRYVRAYAVLLAAYEARQGADRGDRAGQPVDADVAGVDSTI